MIHVRLADPGATIFELVKGDEPEDALAVGRRPIVAVETRGRALRGEDLVTLARVLKRDGLVLELDDHPIVGAEG